MEVGPGGTCDVPAAAELLARSFAGDPGTLHLFPARCRHGMLVAHFRALVSANGSGILIGRCRESARIEGCLIFQAPPERDGGGGWRPLQLAPLLAAPGALLRMTLAAPALRRLEQSASPAGAWTLTAVGVQPELQGTGRGSRLLDHLLRMIDAAGAACYLETLAPRSLPFYRRHGFSVAGEARPRGSVRTWAMVRPPAAAAEPRFGAV